MKHVLLHAFGCDSPVRCTKGYILGAPLREIPGDDDHVSFDARTADDVRCARGAPQRGVASQDREIRRSQKFVTSFLNVEERFVKVLSDRFMQLAGGALS